MSAFRSRIKNWFPFFQKNNLNVKNISIALALFGAPLAIVFFVSTNDKTVSNDLTRVLPGVTPQQNPVQKQQASSFIHTKDSTVTAATTGKTLPAPTAMDAIRKSTKPDQLTMADGSMVSKGITIQADGVTVTESPAPVVRTLGRQEIEDDLHNKDQTYPATETAALFNMKDANQVLTSEAVEKSKALGNAAIQIVVSLNDVAFDIAALNGKSDAQRLAIINERQAILAPSQASLENKLTALGASEFGRIWLGGNRVAAKVPATAVEAISHLPGVVSVAMEQRGGTDSAAYNMFDATNPSGLIAMRNSYMDGSLGNRKSSSSPVRIGIIEHGGDNSCAEHWPGSGHVAFLDWQNGPSRVIKRYMCNGSSCTAKTLNTNPSSGTHGHMVAGVAAGNIEQLQDPTYTTTTDTQARSGVSSEAEIYYYGMACSWDHVGTALQQAVVDNVDVVNMSFTFEGCAEAATQTNSNAAIRAAFQAGVVMVAASGNGGASETDTCKIGWPAFRPEVIAVAGLDTSSSTTAYNKTSLGAGVFLNGGMPLKTAAGSAQQFAGIDFTAPGVMINTLSANWCCGTSAFNAGAAYGSSFASPLVTGFVANLRTAFRNYGWYDWMVSGLAVTNALLSGDGWDGFNAASGSTYSVSAPNRRTGFGRLSAIFPGSIGQWSWTINGENRIASNQSQKFTLNGGNPIPAEVKGLKVAMSFFPTDLQNVSDLDMYVRQCGGGAIIASQTDYDFRNKLFLRADQIVGKCLEIEIKSYKVANNSVEPYWLAWTFRW